MFWLLIAVLWLLIAVLLALFCWALRGVRREIRRITGGEMPHPGMPDAQPWPGLCGDRWEGMTCTRTRGHDGLHADDTSWEML